MNNPGRASLRAACYSACPMLMDFHLHTLVSDGELEPSALLREAAGRGVSHLAISDHDSLGAYRWREGAVFAEARRLGLDLTIGIELDADWDGSEVHLLGFGLRLDEPRLNAHLDAVRAARFERARREIGIVNGLLGAGTITEQDVFAPGRETLMKPHFIHPLLVRGRFPAYEEANAWYRANVKAGVVVPKPGVREAIRLVHDAGGWAALAHPAYYEREGRRVVVRLPELQAMGLDGMEVDYPYAACSPREFSLERERAYVDELRRACLGLGLRVTRGSDSHTARDFERAYGPRA
jgi:predicted metal-dependent phosphoesterase TrpH